MRKESAVTLKEDASLTAGFYDIAKYGPLLEISATVQAAVSRNEEKINKCASIFLRCSGSNGKDDYRENFAGSNVHIRE